MTYFLKKHSFQHHRVDFVPKTLGFEESDIYSYLRQKKNIIVFQNRSAEKTKEVRPHNEKKSKNLGSQKFLADGWPEGQNIGRDKGLTIINIKDFEFECQTKKVMII